MASLVWETSTFAYDSFKVETFKGHSRLSVALDENVTYEWHDLHKGKEDGFVLELKGFGYADLGVPLGEESRWASTFSGDGPASRFRDPRLASLRFKETQQSLRIEGRWKFPVGESALANPKMEAFLYREKNPMRLRVDFWLKKGPTLREIKAAALQSKRLADLKREEIEAKAYVNRKISSEKQLSELDDLGKFCRHPLSDLTDVSLPFLPTHEELNYGRWIPVTTPDNGFIYFVPEIRERDAQYVRLANSLYRDGNYGLVSRTLDFLDTEFPNSPYRGEMKFLRANNLLKLGLEKDAEPLLSEIMAESPKSPAALQSGMYFAAKRAREKNYLAANEAFLWLIEHYPDHRMAWFFHLGTAEALYHLKQTDRAAKEYQWVMERAPDRNSQVEAAIRMGDLSLLRLDHENALADYYRGITHYESEAKRFPVLYLNRAESLYWLAQHDRAKVAFEEFLEKYSAFPGGWRATYRLGEIEAKADHEARSRYWFTETINRFPFSPGATLARLRLMPCGDHGGFTLESQKRFFENEAEHFDGVGEVVTAHYPEFRDLFWVRAMVGWEREADAIDGAIRAIGKTKGPTRPHLVAMLEVLFRRHVRTLLTAGKRREALAFYQDKSEQLPPELRFADPDFLLHLSEAAADLSLGKLALELATKYRAITEKDPAREPASGKGPSNQADPVGKLRIAEERYAVAKALWVEGRSKPEFVTGSPQSEKVRKNLEEVGEESRFSFEKELILGLLDQKQSAASPGGPEALLRSALAHATRAQLLAPDWHGRKSSEGADAMLASWVVSLESRVGDPKVALEMCANLEKFARKNKSQEADPELRILGLPPSLTLLDVLFLEGDLHERQNEWSEAAEIYARAVEDGLGGNRARFSQARALLKLGGGSGSSSQNSAVKLLLSIQKTKGQDLWKKLAGELLSNLEAISHEQFNQAKEGAQ